MRVDLRVGTQMSNERLPNKLFAFVLLSFLFVLEVKTTEKPGIEAHISKEPWIRIGMSKWIDLPANSRCDSELLHQELMTEHHVVDLIFIVSAGLIMHAPAGIHELETSLLN